jgi:hypothetical protein
MIELTDEFRRLAYIAGISDWDDAKMQATRCSEMPSFLQGGINDAWNKCLPEWVASGRVRDLSLCVRVPKYWPSFSKFLGQAFVENFRADYQFLIDQLDCYSINSTEYLCVCDLVELMLHEYVYDPPAVRDRLFALHHALHPVIQFECKNSREYHGHSDSIGQFLRQMFAHEYTG